MEQTLIENKQTDFNTTESTDKDNQVVQQPAKHLRHLKGSVNCWIKKMMNRRMKRTT